MGQLVYILGRSGTGKSFSMRNFDQDKLAVINVQGKILPFKGSGKIKMVSTDDADTIVRTIKGFANTYKSIVVDDFQYVMANEFMRRSKENGWDKFTEIARHAWDIADCVRNLPNDVIVYILCHTDTDNEGVERLKTIGKLLDEKIVLEGMSTIVLKTNVSDGKYTFLTQNNGKDTAKSPDGMFPSYAIENDLKYVDDKIRSYYEFEGAKSEEEMTKEDEAVKTDIKPEEKKTRRGRRAQTEEEKPTETSEEKETEETNQKTRHRRRVSDEMKEEREKVQEKNAEAVANAGIEEAGDKEEVDFDEINMPEVEKLPRRKRRSPEPEPESEPESDSEETIDEQPTRRRRRRV